MSPRVRARGGISGATHATQSSARTRNEGGEEARAGRQRGVSYLGVVPRHSPAREPAVRGSRRHPRGSQAESRGPCAPCRSPLSSQRMKASSQTSRCAAARYPPHLACDSRPCDVLRPRREHLASGSARRGAEMGRRSTAGTGGGHARVRDDHGVQRQVARRHQRGDEPVPEGLLWAVRHMAVGDHGAMCAPPHCPPRCKHRHARAAPLPLSPLLARCSVRLEKKARMAPRSLSAQASFCLRRPRAVSLRGNDLPWPRSARNGRG